MSVPEVHRKAVATLPEALRQLLEAELAAGNGITEFGHSFPAPPAGAYFKLAQPLLSRPRKSGNGLLYDARNNSQYAGEITDPEGRFFLLEPAAADDSYPDMDAIRAARQPPAFGQLRVATTPSPEPEGPPTLRQRFERSLVMDYEKWHDGTGYDLAALAAMSSDERAAVAQLLIGRGVKDWRDVEALAAIAQPGTQAALTAAFRSGNAEIRNAVARFGPELIPEPQRVASLVRGLETAVLFGGLSQTLDQVADFHPPAIVAALLRGALARDGEVAVHFAAMLTYVHGKAAEPFDLEQRPFFLRFNTARRQEREAAFRELCARIDVDPGIYLKPSAAQS